MKLVSLVTINLNTAEVTEGLLDSLINVNAYPNIEVIVVDNNSRIDPVPGWQQKYPGMTFIRSDRNRGFTGGNNLGIAASKGDYVFVINNDTVVTKDLIGKLVNTLDENPQIGVISPKINYYDQPEILQYTGYTKMNYFTARNKCIGQFEKDAGQYDYLTGRTGYAHGAAMLVRREAMEKAGLLSENFFIYYEELEWCERIRKSGYEIWVDMSALLYHKESMTVGKVSAFKEYYMNRNRILFNRKHAPRYAFAIFTLFYTTVVVPKTMIGYIRKRQFSFFPALRSAIWWNLTNGVNSSNAVFPPKF